MNLKLKRSTWRLIAILLPISFLVIYTLFFFASHRPEVEPVEEVMVEDTIPPVMSKVYGLPADSFAVWDGTIQSGHTFGKILTDNGVEYATMLQLAERAKPVIDVRLMRAGKSYVFLRHQNDTAKRPDYFVYEESMTRYYLFSLKDSLWVEQKDRPVTKVERKASGTIESSLFLTLQNQNLPVELAMEMSDIYAWTINFFRIQKGDKFTVIYEEKFVDDTLSVGLGRIKAVVFHHAGKPLYAFYFQDSDGFGEYFDEEGNTLRKAFLKAPLKFSRISSKFNPKRLHPVLKTVRAHLGTDFAAPHGTPILATADGTVSAASYTSGNGNYVKIRHNSVYETQYLHMSRFEKGIKAGVRVKQGDVIGYVGSTGLATGPHVCYRFWKNGSQVDPFKEKLPEADPIKEQYREQYFEMIEPLRKRLDE